MFPITMSFTVSTAGELARLVAATGTTGANLAELTNTPLVKEADAKKDVKAAPAQAAASTAAAPEQKATFSEQKAESLPAATAARTIDEAKALTMKLVASKGRDEAVKLLGKYGVPVAAKLAADQIAAFCADAEAVLAS